MIRDDDAPDGGHCDLHAIAAVQAPLARLAAQRVWLTQVVLSILSSRAMK